MHRRFSTHILFLAVLLLSVYAKAQRGVRMDLRPNNEKSLVYFGYGIGNSRWFSEIKESALYDRQGVAIQRGNFSFRASSPINYYDGGILFPIGNFRAGLGISFEKSILTTVQLNSSSVPLTFDESFRFDMMYTQFEIPFFPKARSAFSAAANFRVGYFNFTGVQRLNLFGNDNQSSSWFFSLSPQADYAILNSFYLFVQPMVGFKFFNRQAIEPEGSVHHTIINYSVMVGLRFDPSGIR